MTRSRRIVLALVCAEVLLAALGAAFAALGALLPAVLTLGAMVLLLSAALVGIWRAVQATQAALNDRIGRLERRLKRPTAADPAPQGSPAAPEAFRIGREAGARSPLALSEPAQAAALAGAATVWQPSARTDPDRRAEPIRLAVLGASESYPGLDPARWAIAGELFPGMLTAQAEHLGAGLILGDSRVFAAGAWAQAVDASGSWMVRDLLELRDWAARNGATLVLSSRDPLPAGDNSKAIRSAFHVEVNDAPVEPVEGAPVPAVHSVLRELHEALHAARRTATEEVGR